MTSMNIVSVIGNLNHLSKLFLVDEALTLELHSKNLRNQMELILSCFWGTLESKVGVILSLPLLQGSFWPGMVVPVRVLSLGQIDTFESYYN